MRSTCLVLLIAVGCSTAAVRENDPIPFHVAVVPISARVEQSVFDESEGEPGVLLELEEGSVTAELRRTLAGSCFVDATVLPYPEDREAFEQQSFEVQGEWWAEKAREVHADLVLECDLKFSPDIDHGTNEKFWLNLPLFLLGGPFCWFVDDRSYRATAELSCDLYDMNPVYTQRLTMSDRRARVIGPLTPEFAGIDLDFVDRARWGSYFVSCVWPAGLLATENETVKTRVETEVIQSLVTGVVRDIRGREELVVEAQQLVNFFVDTKSVTVRRVAADEVEFEGDVILLRDLRVDALDEYRLYVAGQEIARKEFADASLDESLSKPRSRYYRYSISERVTVPADTRFIQLRIWDGSEQRNTRSCTFPVPASDAGSPGS